MAYVRLHVQQADGHLPMVCMRCGAPAAVVKTKKLSWYPRGIVLILVVACGLPGIVVAFILYLALRKTAQLQAPLCEDHERHWSTRLIVNWVTGVIAVGLSTAGFVAFIVEVTGRGAGDPAEDLQLLLCFGSSFVFVAWLIVAGILRITSIRPDEITRTHILLNGVAEAFVDAVEEAEIERRVRLRQWQEEDAAERSRRIPADEVDSTPPKPATNDTFEEDRPRRTPPRDAIEE